MCGSDKFFGGVYTSKSYPDDLYCKDVDKCKSHCIEKLKKENDELKTSLIKVPQVEYEYETYEKDELVKLVKDLQVEMTNRCHTLNQEIDELKTSLIKVPRHSMNYRYMKELEKENKKLKDENEYYQDKLNNYQFLANQYADGSITNGYGDEIGSHNQLEKYIEELKQENDELKRRTK